MARRSPTYYDVLGVDPSASADQIHRAYLRHARRLHPDTAGGDARAMQALNEAWHVLRDPRRRFAYDAGLDERPPRPSPPVDGGFPDDAETPPAAALAEDGAPRASRTGDLLLLVPAALLLSGLGCMVLGMMTFNPGLVGLAFALLLLSGAAFAVTPFLSLARGRKRRWR